jgi:hypothetical protein
MDEMTAFERRLAAELQGMVGPMPRFDVSAITRAAATTPPRWGSPSVFSSTKLVVAGAVLAMFGGLLLNGLLTTQPDEKPAPVVGVSAAPSPDTDQTAGPTLAPDPSIRSHILPGVDLVTEEVEPGVYRVVSDGVRELSRPIGLEAYDIYDSAIAAGRDGSVWIFNAQGFFRLGDEAEHAWDGARFIRFARPSVAPDGTVWWLDGDVLRVFEGRRWRVELRGANGFHMWPDGTMWTRDRQGRLLRGDGTTWTDVIAEIGAEDPGGARPGRLWVSPRIDEALAADGPVTDPAVELLYDGTPNHHGLEVLFLSPVSSGAFPAGAVDADLVHVDMADAGDWWIYQTLDVPLAGGHGTTSAGRTERVHYLIHVDGVVSLVYSDEDGVPETGHSDVSGLLEAGGDGRVWMSVGVWSGAQLDCGGAASFDGETWRHVLRDVCVYDLDVAPDGSVWLHGATGGYGADAVETYVIIPEDAMVDG